MMVFGGNKRLKEYFDTYPFKKNSVESKYKSKAA